VHHRADAFTPIQSEQGLGALGHPLAQLPVSEPGLPRLPIALA
jgi:hypothetical protein